jgi:signal peptidase I
MCLIGVLYIPVQELLFPLLDKLHKFLLDHYLMPWLGVLIGFVVIYQFYWILKYWKADISVYSFGLALLIVGLYVYYRHLCPSCHFWMIVEEYPQIAFVDLLIIPGAVIFALQRCVYLFFFKRKVLNARPPPLLWALGIRAVENDKPINLEDEDWLGFTGQVERLFDVLQSLELKEEPSSLTLGVIAQWGKGKSSFINLLMAKAKRQGDIVVCFNPRNSKNVAQIQEDFFDAFAKELSMYYTGFGFLLGRYTKHLGLLGQYEWTRPVESLLTLLLPEKDEQAINAALYTIGRRVYVAIDDLDRLTGEEIIEVLKLVDRNASFNNVVFVMAYDKEYVNNVLRKHLDHGLDHSFIDKYVTWEVTLPEVDSEILKEKMKSYLEDHLFDLSKEEKGRVLEGWRYVDDIVIGYLESARHLKRYLNLMIHRYRQVYNKVDPADFFLLSLLQYRYLGIYNNLAWGMYVELYDNTYYGIPVEWRKRLSEELPSEALTLIQKMFFNRPVGREEMSDLPSYGDLKLIRSKEAFPYYFRYANYVKDKVEGE